MRVRRTELFLEDIGNRVSLNEWYTAFQKARDELEGWCIRKPGLVKDIAFYVSQADDSRAHHNEWVLESDALVKQKHAVAALEEKARATEDQTKSTSPDLSFFGKAAFIKRST